MKCTLIIPAWEPEDIFPTKTAASQINYWQPLGTLSVAASLQEAGHEVSFLNGAFLSHQQIIEQVKAAAPAFVGLYSTTFGWPKAKQTAADIKAALPRIFIAVGGPYPIALKDKCLADCEWIDAVVTGEGEITVPEILAKYAAGKSLAGVAGVAYREAERMHLNLARPLITELDLLPFPARELLGEAGAYIPPPATYRRKPVAVIMTSRGCNRHCIYCFQIDKHRKSGIRYRSVGNVIKEIELCLSQGYREIKFIDETLAADYDRAMALAKEIQRRGLDFSWFASACVNQVDSKLLREFKKAGCWAVLMGAESGVQKNLNTIRKGSTLRQIKKAVRAAQRAGIRVFTPFLFGIPGETFEEGLQTIEFACELDPDIANFHSLTPFPGTELYDNIEKYGTISNDLTNYTYQGAAFVPYTMTRKEIADLRQIAFKRFYSRPKFLLRRVLGLRSFNDLRAAFTGLRSLFWLWTTDHLFHRKCLRAESSRTQLGQHTAV